MVDESIGRTWIRARWGASFLDLIVLRRMDENAFVERRREVGAKLLRRQGARAMIVAAELDERGEILRRFDVREYPDRRRTDDGRTVEPRGVYYVVLGELGEVAEVAED